jgi:hypothetical protein
MSKLIKIDEESKQWIFKLSERFRISRLRTSVGKHRRSVGKLYPYGQKFAGC